MARFEADGNGSPVTPPDGLMHEACSQAVALGCTVTVQGSGGGPVETNPTTWLLHRLASSPLRHTAGLVTPSGPEMPPGAVTERILNVDDFEPQRHARSVTLRNAGFEVREAATGHQALSLAAEYQPALVVLDIHLPDIDGLEVCRRLKADPATARVLVLHVSATFVEPGARVEALENGADGYLPEPLDPKELVAQARSLLRLREAELQARQALEALRVSEERLRLAQEAGGVGIFDWDLSTGEVVWTPELETIYGMPAPAERASRPEAWRARVHPDDREGIAEATRRWLASSERELKGDYRFIRPDGEERWIAARSLAVRDAEGRAIRVIGTNTDITERKRVEEALQRSEARYRFLFDAIDEGFCVIEIVRDQEGKARDYRFLEANPAFVKHTGLLDPVGKTVRELAPNIEDYWIETYDRVARTGEAVRLEQASPALGRHYDLYAFRAGLPQEERVAVLFTDVTAREETQQALRESEEWMRLAAEAGRVGTWDMDFVTGRLRWGGVHHELAGLRPEDWDESLETFLRCVHPDDRDRLLGAAAEATADRRAAFSEDYRIVLPNGDIRWMHARGELTYGENGRPTRNIGAVVDVTPLKLVEQSLSAALAEVQQREAEIVSIYDSAPMGLCVFDRDGRYLRINRRLAEINGLPPEAHIGRLVREVVPGIAEQAERLLRHVLETGLPVHHVELAGEVPSRPGVVGTWMENWEPVRDAQGAVTAVNVGVEDVTRLKQIEKELRAANQVKDDFLATLSHELRTPLSAILGWAQLLQRGGLSEATARQALDAIARNAEAQRQLIADVLDVSRMVAGKLRLELTPVDLAETVRLAVESMRPAVEHKGVQLELFCEPFKAIAEADAARLQQILWNLLSNAAKFTPAGGRVTVALREAGSSYELSVRDTGMGIRPEFLPHVFDRFAQADTSTTRRHTGLGLGLSIVRELVQLHGGQVSVTSDGEGMGATFTVTLPLPKDSVVRASAAASLEHEAAPRSSSRLAGLNVLVVDDLEDGRSLTAAIVEKAGGVVTLAGSGEEALVRVSQNRPDVIVADIAMPEMDGYEFLRRLRALPPEAGGTIPAIALTAYGSADLRARSSAAGFLAHFTKPAAADQLVSTMLAATARSAGRHRRQ